jgi:hypothetical protein
MIASSPLNRTSTSAIRRFLAVLLTPVFAMSFAVTLLAVRMDDTLLEPDFYTAALHRLDAYDFFYDALLPPILEQWGLDVTRAPASLGLSAEGLSAKMKRIIPPETLELQVSDAIEGVLPYLAGRSDSFELTLEPGRRVEDAADVIRDLVREPELYGYLLDGFVREPLQPAWSAFEKSVPFPLDLTLDDIFEGVKTVFSAPWLAEQADAVLGALVPYLTGKTESFSVVIPLDERAGVAAEVLKGWLHRVLEGGGYHYLVRQAVPRLRLLLASSVKLPYEISFSDEELGTVVALVLPLDWMRAQLDRGIGDLERYFTGRSRTVSFSIPLKGRADAAALLLAVSVNVKARAAYAGLRECTAVEERALGSVPGALPSCRLPGFEYDEVRARAGYDTVTVLRRAFSAFPERIDVSEEELRAAINRSGDGPSVAALRKSLTEGYRFDVNELRRLLEEGAPPDRRSASWDRFQSFRLQLRNGIRLTEADLRRAVGRESLAGLDRARFWLRFARRGLVVLLAFEVLLLVGLARLGGGSRESRLIWGGSALLVAGPTLAGTALGVEALRGLTTNLIEGFRSGRALTEMLLALRDELFASFTGPLVAQGIVVALAGLALVVWGVSRARRRAGAASATR